MLTLSIQQAKDYIQNNFKTTGGGYKAGITLTERPETCLNCEVMYLSPSRMIVQERNTGNDILRCVYCAAEFITPLPASS